MQRKSLNIAPPVKAAIWFTICSILQKGIQMLTIPLFTRILTTEQYGQFSLFQSWLGIISIFATLNLASGVFNNGMIRFPEDKDTYTSSMQGLSTVSTFLLFGIYLIGTDWWDSLLGLPHIVVLGIFLELLFNPALLYWMARQRFEYRYKALVAVTLINALLNPLLGFIAVSVTPERGVARILSTCLLNACVGGLFYVYQLYKGKRFFVREYWKYALAFNLPLMPHYLSQIVLSQADRIMIERMFGKSPVAVYSIAYSLGLAINVVTSSVNAAIVPWTYKMCKSGQYERIGRTSELILLLVTAIAIFPIFMAPEIVAVMGPAEYADATWIIPPVAAAGYCMMVYSFFANIEFYYEENKFIMVGSTAAAFSNIVLNFIGMKLFGYIAAGYTTVICYVILTVAHYNFMRKVIRKHNVGSNIYRVRTILGISLGSCLVTVVGMVLYPFPIVRYGVVLAGLVAAFAARKKIWKLFSEIKERE